MLDAVPHQEIEHLVAVGTSETGILHELLIAGAAHRTDDLGVILVLFDLFLPKQGGKDLRKGKLSVKQRGDLAEACLFCALAAEAVLLPHSVHTSDRLALLSSCEDPAAIGLSGIYLETEKGEWAFLLGYPSTDKIYDMSIVKYSPDLSRNAVPVCICEMAKLVADSYPWINLEDDLGEKGLRRMKTLYHPLFLLGSYTAYREIPPVFP